MYFKECSFNGTYSDDLDIISLHSEALNNFKKNKTIKINELQNSIDEIKNELDNIEMYEIDRKLKSRRLTALLTELNGISSDKLRNEYSTKVKLIIEEYSSLPRMKNKISFKDDIAEFKRDSNSGRRQILIIQYLNILRDYFTVDISRKINGIFQIKKETQTSTISGNVNQETIQKSSHENRENFKKAIAKYQGKEDNRLPEDIYEKLDDYFKKYSLPMGSEVRRCNVNGNWHFRYKKGNVDIVLSKELLFKALTEIKYNEFYDSFYIICHRYWGWKLRDISDIEESILKDYDLKQPVYEKIKFKYNKKISSINVWYDLYRLLKKHHHPCEVRDFKIVKTDEIIMVYEEIWDVYCKELEWECN
jgi:hypothetical protein